MSGSLLGVRQGRCGDATFLFFLGGGVGGGEGRISFFKGFFKGDMLLLKPDNISHNYGNRNGALGGIAVK